jgi:hypothetical protein
MFNRFLFTLVAHCSLRKRRRHLLGRLSPRRLRSIRFQLGRTGLLECLQFETPTHIIVGRRVLLIQPRPYCSLLPISHLCRPVPYQGRSLLPLRPSLIAVPMVQRQMMELPGRVGSGSPPLRRDHCCYHQVAPLQIIRKARITESQTGMGRQVV